MVGGVLLGYAKVFGSHLATFCHWWDVKPPGGGGGGGDFFHLSRVSFPPSQADSFCIFFLFACRMTRGYEEVSSSHAWRRRVTHREMPTMSSLVAAMSTEELGLYSQFHAKSI